MTKTRRIQYNRFPHSIDYLIKYGECPYTRAQVCKCRFRVVPILMHMHKTIFYKHVVRIQAWTFCALENIDSKRSSPGEQQMQRLPFSCSSIQFIISPPDPPEPCAGKAPLNDANNLLDGQVSVAHNHLLKSICSCYLGRIHKG